MFISKIKYRTFYLLNRIFINNCNLLNETQNLKNANEISMKNTIITLANLRQINLFCL